jgi:hypothetical protein
MGVLQLEHYRTQFSNWTVDWWTSGLITRLLELTQGLWKQCNAVLHAVDDQGLPMQCALELENPSIPNFSKVPMGLHKGISTIYVVGLMM